MTIQLEDIINAICSPPPTAHANDFQKVFLIANAKEAKLAYDVLVAYGFLAKIYHDDPAKPSKLYVTNPTISGQQLEYTFSAALAYAKTLKQIQQHLDDLCSSNVPALGSPHYTMAFANSGTNAKQILIQLLPAVAIKAQPKAAAAISTSPAVQAAASEQVKTTRKIKRQANKEDGLSTGPAVGKGHYPGKLGAQGSLEEQSAFKKFTVYIRANIAVSGFAFLAMIVILGVLFSFFVFAKAFICPDFASMKRSAAWYCKSNDDTDANKQKQQQQQQPDAPPQR